MDSYDEIPYHSAPFTETHPVNLAVVGRLFGLATPDPDHCRVLELGCASGGNLIPMAWHLPGSRFTGVELSPTQAEAGADLIRGLGLTNVEIRRGDILEVDPGPESVDYLIVHGVYSWVPAEVQERILWLCARCLSPTGIAYVSYNTLPGWRMRGMLRDALLYHVRRTSSPTQRLAQASVLLERLGGALAGLDAFSARYLREEIAYLRAAHPSYLYHEYLEARNEPLLFSDFVERAARHGLQYLADSDLASMFASSLGDGASALVEGIEDQIEQEQYLDFVSNRNFRQTLLCRAGPPVERVVGLEVLDRFAAFSPLEPPRRLDLRVTKPAPFRRPDGRVVEVHHPLTRAALAALHATYPDAVALADLRAHAQRQVAAAGAMHLAQQVDHLPAELFSLFANAAVGLDVRARAYPRPSPGNPTAHPLARAQAARGLGHLATPRHGTLRLDAFAARLVDLLDGRATREELIRQLADEITRGRLRLDQPPAHPDRLLKQVAANTDRLLDLFRRHAVLEAAPARPPPATDPPG
jgi:SAM-dependent methyltransferase